MKRSEIEKKQVGLRTNRMFKAEGCWFFKTREGNTVGPFADELETSTQLEVYIRLVDAGLLPVQDESSPARSTANSAG